MTNPTPRPRRAKTPRVTPVGRAVQRAADEAALRAAESKQSRTANATSAIQRRRHDKIARELAFFGFIVFPPEVADRAALRKLEHLAVVAPETLEALGPRADGRYRSTVRPPERS